MKSILQNIKLIIWDLDETLWKGVLLERKVIVPKEHVKVIHDLTDCGIMQSICSKNDFAAAKTRLEDAGVWDMFVFSSISWESKGPRIKGILQNMSLRAEDTLFLDDNPSNRGEAEYYAPGINVAGPEVMSELMRQVDSLERKDTEHKRLQRYKTLEARSKAAEAFSDSERFLYDSDIQVEIHNDCFSQIARINELLLRTNQLNFTKKRISLDELEALLADPSARCGYITSEDKYGDYGIIGFFALRGDRLEHFAFSCRTMGQRIEQWIYALLGFPEVDVVEPVASQLNKFDCPGWINQAFDTSWVEAKSSPALGCRVLLKGPCDLSHSLVYLKNAGVFDAELGYTTDEGKTVAAHNHSVYIEGLCTWSEGQKREIAKDCIFVDPPMLSGKFFSGNYDLIVLSTSFESYYQRYRKKDTELRVAFAGINLTNQKHWPGLIDGTFYTGGNTFTEEYLKEFSEKYEYIGITRPEEYLQFLQKCLEWLPERTRLCLILGATKFVADNDIVKFRHEKLNSAIKDFAGSQPRISFIEIDDFISDVSDYTDGINHFSARVYYEIARAIAATIHKTTGQEIVTRSYVTVALDSVFLKIRKRLSKIVSPESGLYKPMKEVYDRLYKRRS